MKMHLWRGFCICVWIGLRVKTCTWRNKVVSHFDPFWEVLQTNWGTWLGVFGARLVGIRIFKLGGRPSQWLKPGWVSWESFWLRPSGTTWKKKFHFWLFRKGIIVRTGGCELWSTRTEKRVHATGASCVSIRRPCWYLQAVVSGRELPNSFPYVLGGSEYGCQ